MPPAGGLYLTGGCDFLICGTFAATVFTLCGVLEFMSDLCKLSFLSPVPAFASLLSRASRASTFHDIPLG